VINIILNVVHVQSPPVLIISVNHNQAVTDGYY